MNGEQCDEYWQWHLGAVVLPAPASILVDSGRWRAATRGLARRHVARGTGVVGDCARVRLGSWEARAGRTSDCNLPEPVALYRQTARSGTEGLKARWAERLEMSGEPSVPISTRRSSSKATHVSHTNSRKLRRLLHGDLDTILLTALKKSQSERYGTSAAFAEDLRRDLRNEPILARSDSSGGGRRGGGGRGGGAGAGGARGAGAGGGGGAGA